MKMDAKEREKQQAFADEVWAFRKVKEDEK